MAVFKDVVIQTVYACADGEFHFPPRIARKSDAETATYTASESRRAAVMVLIAPVTAESDVIECHSEVGADEITLDANHPLAGKELTFEIEIVEVK